MPPVLQERPPAAALTEGRKSDTEQALVIAFMVIPLLALAAAVPLAWGWGLSWLDVGLAAVFYVLSGLGVTVGFHRYFTTARSRRSGRCGSPSPWQGASRSRAASSAGWPTIGATTPSPTGTATPTHPGCSAPVRPPWSAASGTPTWAGCSAATAPTPRRFAPDLLADRDIAAVDRSFILLTLASLGLPALIGGLVSLVVVGRSDRALLGRARPGGAAAPRHLVRSTRSATWWATARSPRVTAPGTCGGSPCSRSASRGTTCTTPTRPARGTG